jgi:hypothetical protein
MIGTGESPLPSDWLDARPDVLEFVGFPDKGRPSVEEFDFLAVYLAGHQKVVATLYADSDPYFDAKRIKSRPAGRWPWIVDVKPLLVVPDVDFAPHISELGIRGLSVRSHSHIEIDDATWMRITGGLAGASAVGREQYVPAYAV